ncbi:uncharacterized protein LOC62_03G004096 [Vanrija pseudolonga]|uniref:Uncharacterized protein n=1 Tax=Vanrija pseudolonga TaxID=143232 RepID=A0AAF0Y9N5_9TREE|nr:hypothetical protein LOC62_03G004096 [Vanrija pseudolonga]
MTRKDLRTAACGRALGSLSPKPSDENSLAWLAWFEERHLAGRVLAQVFAAHDVKFRSTAHYPTLQPPYPSNLLTKGGLIHEAFDNARLDVNELRAGVSMEKTGLPEDPISVTMCSALIQVASDVHTEFLKAKENGIEPRVIIPMTSSQKTTTTPHNPAN